MKVEEAKVSKYHSDSTGKETVRRWKGPGDIEVVATRDPSADNQWRIDAGPSNLVGRHFRHIRDARIAVKQAPQG